MPWLTIRSQKRLVPMSIGGDRNALNREIGADGKRNWSFDSVPKPCCLGVYTRVLESAPSFDPSYANNSLFSLHSHGLLLPLLLAFPRLRIL